MRLFTERALQILVKQYSRSMKSESKQCIYQIVHLSMMIHYPQGLAGDKSKGAHPSEDIELWRQMLDGFYSCIDMEIKKLTEDSLELIKYLLSDEFSTMAAMLVVAVSRIFKHHFELLSMKEHLFSFTKKRMLMRRTVMQSSHTRDADDRR